MTDSRQREAGDLFGESLDNRCIEPVHQSHPADNGSRELVKEALSENAHGAAADLFLAGARTEKCLHDAQEGLDLRSDSLFDHAVESRCGIGHLAGDELAVESRSTPR